MPGEDAVPADLRAGDTVIYHLPRNYRNDEDDYQGGHRLGLITRVYRRPRTERVALDLSVYLAQGDDPRNTTGIVPVHDAVYDAECPPGTFCEYTTDSDELPTVGDIQGSLGQSDRSSQGSLSESRRGGPQKPVTGQGVPVAEVGDRSSSLPGETDSGQGEDGSVEPKPDADTSSRQGDRNAGFKGGTAKDQGEKTLPGDPNATIPDAPQPIKGSGTEVGAGVKDTSSGQGEGKGKSK